MTSLRATSDDPEAIREVLENMDALGRMYDLQPQLPAAVQRF